MKIKKRIEQITPWWFGLAVITWLIYSIMASTVKSASGNCGKTYYIDYVVFTNLFCEVKK